MGIEAILNFIRIDERTGLGGQPTADQLRGARAEGYEAVVNLAPAVAEGGTELDERGLLEAQGIEYHHIPVPWDGPELEEFEAFVAVMDGLGTRNTLVHCAANFRVTAFYALYATHRLGWSEEEADALIDRVWNSRPDYRMDDNWKRFVASARARIL